MEAAGIASEALVPQLSALNVVRLHRLAWSCCGITTRAELPAGVPNGPFGRLLWAILAMLAGSYRLAERPIQQLVSDLFGRHRVRRYR